MGSAADAPSDGEAGASEGTGLSEGEGGATVGAGDGDGEGVGFGELQAARTSDRASAVLTRTACGR